MTIAVLNVNLHTFGEGHVSDPRYRCARKNVKECNQLIPICVTHNVGVERGGSAVECRTRNRESPGSNPL